MYDDLKPPMVQVPNNETSPVKVLRPDELKLLGNHLSTLFNQYVADRRIAELRWIKNLRQYLGYYDPEIDKALSPSRSRAYPKVTRVKCISTLAKIMDLMFPGNERNWSIQASPSADINPADAMVALQEALQRDQEAGIQPQINDQYVQNAIQTLADKRADSLSILLDDQLQELGGDQTSDYIALNREVLRSGILFGLGVLRGPYARTVPIVKWSVDPQTGQPAPQQTTSYKPMFEFLPVWDFYPDMSAKTFQQMDGYFMRLVMSRSQVRDLADRPDFFGDLIRKYLSQNASGNYKLQPYETELKALGVKINVNEYKVETTKYEVIVWNGPVSGQMLQSVGIDVPEDKLGDDVIAEIWTIGDCVIKAVMNPWAILGDNVKTIHTFSFDQDDTSLIGHGLPNVVRDSQMSICAATRMLLDNASVVCGPNVEVNLKMLLPGQDITDIHAYKVWVRDDDDLNTMNIPALRNLPIDGHLPDLQQLITLFMQFADLETFVGPASGGDLDHSPSEPFRTAAGASMLRSDAALPFKDIIRNFDSFTQSLIQSMVAFNRQFNPNEAMEGDYNVVARGATSLIAKEIRGIQVDNIAASLRPEEMLHVDERKLVEARFRTRDLEDILVSSEEAERRKQSQQQAAASMQEQQQKMIEAQIREVLSNAFKNIAQGQKNQANADAQVAKSAIDILEQGLLNAGEGSEASKGNSKTSARESGNRTNPSAPGVADLANARRQGQLNGLPY